MPRLALLFVCGFAAPLVLGACTKVTRVSSASPIQVQAQPPAPPLADLPPVPQPPPPRRVILEGDLLVLDEALTFGDDEQLSGEHQDILAEVAAWLAEHPEVLELSVEVHSVGQTSRRKQLERSRALATQIVDALVGQGVASERLLAASVGGSPDDQRHVALRVSKRSEVEE
ncbi:MAG: hypothetical protein R6X02_02295 [Enhygromyxa sp.]